MKFKYLLFIVFLLTTLYSSAQKFNGGILAGVAASQVAGDTYTGYNKAGIYAGAFVNLQVSPRSILQMELEYFQKGSRKNPNPKKDDYAQYLFRVNYVELPLLYQFVFNEYVKVEAGPSIGYRLGYFEEVDYNERAPINPPAKLSYQINLGICVSITKNLKVDLRTNNSFLNIRSHNVTGDVHRFFDYGQYNDSLVLSLLVQFGSAAK